MEFNNINKETALAILQDSFKEIINLGQSPIIKGCPSESGIYDIAIFNPDWGVEMKCKKLSELAMYFIRLSDNMIDGWIECATKCCLWISLGMTENAHDPIMAHMFWRAFELQATEFGKFTRSMTVTSGK
ncbi:MAG: hypothetical protein NC339_00900 [Muribaculaceae bacterium]|nr:hypothetical protein [Muribaculaceae bacterium]